MSVMMNGQESMEPLDFSKHAARRVRQRGLRDRDVELAVECGTPIAGDGIVLLDSDVRRETARRKREIQAFERLRGCKVVVSEGTIITCHHADGQRTARAHRGVEEKGEMRNVQ